MAGHVATDVDADDQAFVDSREPGDNGTWDNAQEISGIDKLTNSDARAVSCPGTGSCVAAGRFNGAPDADLQAYISKQNGTAGAMDSGTFGGARQVAGNLNTGDFAQAEAISCSFAGVCAIGGLYTNTGGGHEGFVADLIKPLPTSTALTLSAAKIRFGHEQAEHLTVLVKPASGSAPAGRVTITTGSAKLCVISLKNGTGRCTLTARRLRAGTYKLAARYGGDHARAASISPAKKLTVTK